MIKRPSVFFIRLGRLLRVENEIRQFFSSNECMKEIYYNVKISIESEII